MAREASISAGRDLGYGGVYGLLKRQRDLLIPNKVALTDYQRAQMSSVPVSSGRGKIPKMKKYMIHFSPSGTLTIPVAVNLRIEFEVQEDANLS
jgi:hypothetical protein